jgi:hypothetical protein
MISKTPLRHRLYHLELNVVPYFVMDKDPRIYIAIELQSRQDLAVDVPR